MFINQGLVGIYVMTKLSESGKPTTAGQKPKHKGASKKVTKEVQKILASANEDSF